MALETRGARKFFYLSTRKGTRVFKTYVAGGFAAQIAAEHYAELRQEKQIFRAQEGANLDRLSAVEKLLKTAHQRVESAAELHLLAAGFHRPARGEWRRRRC